MAENNQSTRIVYCFDISNDILASIQPHLHDPKFSVSFKDCSDDNIEIDTVDDLVLILFNAHVASSESRISLEFSKRLPLESRGIGLYYSDSPLPDIFQDIIKLKDLVSAHSPEKIAFAIRRELETLELERNLDRYSALLESSDRRLSLLTDSDGRKEDRRIDLPKWILTRHEFTQYLDEHLYLVNQNNQAALALIEIDHYSAIPKEQEKDFNSRCVSFVANILLTRCKSTEILAYFDSNIFALFSTRYTQKSFPTFIEHLRLAVTENLFEENSNFFQMKCSAGVCFWSEHIANTRELIARAQQACATASIGDGNQVHIYQTLTTPFNVMEELPEYKQQIKSALREERFRLVYQPIVNLNLIGEENYAILIRMLDKKGKHLSPDKFIPVAENTGLIDYIDQWVIQQSVELAKRSQKSERSRSYFLKISGYSIDNEKIVKCLYYYLKKAKVDGKALVIQIDYVEFINNPQKVIAFIEKLTEAGCRIAFDHFGFGEYSVDQLKDLSLDFIKIDGSFTRNMLNQPSHLKTIENIQATAEECGIKTIAKSVENADALARLWNVGVDAVQGYFIQEPNESMRFDFTG